AGRGRPMRGRLVRSSRLFLQLAAGAAPAGRVRAQPGPGLVAAARLAQDGLSDSARAVAGRILQSLQPTDSLYPEALYTLGLLAATERERRLQLRPAGGGD